MGWRDLISKLPGAEPQISAQETELKRLSSEGDEARRQRQPARALELYEQGLELAKNEGYLQGQEIFLGQLGALHTEQRHHDLAHQTLGVGMTTVNRTDAHIPR